MQTTSRKTSGVVAKRLIRRAYNERKNERAFVQAVYAVEITPQVEARIEAAKARATRALNAPFLEQYRAVA
jgi:hypothetical protein